MYEFLFHTPLGLVVWTLVCIAVGVGYVHALDAYATRKFNEQPHIVWEYILRNFSNDNNFDCMRSQFDYMRAKPGLERLIRAGYFKDNPYDIESSYWQIAAGEETNAAAFFSKEREGYRIVQRVLQQIFDRVEASS